jgi:hypothetical protein
MARLRVYITKLSRIFNFFKDRGFLVLFGKDLKLKYELTTFLARNEVPLYDFKQGILFYFFIVKLIVLLKVWNKHFESHLIIYLLNFFYLIL